MAQSRLQPVGIEEVPSPDSPSVSRETPQAGQAAFASLLMLSLKALSQRALIALASLVDLALIGSAFALWMMIIKEPSTLQLCGVGMYAMFVLSSVLVRHRYARRL